MQLYLSGDTAMMETGVAIRLGNVTTIIKPGGVQIQIWARPGAPGFYEEMQQEVCILQRAFGDCFVLTNLYFRSRTPFIRPWPSTLTTSMMTPTSEPR